MYGNGWPAGLVLDNSGYGFHNKEEWWVTKLRVLKSYQFNICSENTAYPYYCTEKIWHSISSGCVPIYHAKGTRILETFPEGSFINASEFGGAGELLRYLKEQTLSASYEILKRAHKVMEAEAGKIKPVDERLADLLKPLIRCFQSI